MEELAGLSTKLEPYLAVMEPMLPPRVSSYRVLAVPSLSEVEKEASRVIEAVKTLILEGYKQGVAKEIAGLDPGAVEYLENLLDMGFKRVALVLGYEKLGGRVEEMVGSLYLEAFTYLTSTPKTFMQAGTSTKKITE